MFWYFRISITPVGQSTTIRFVTTFRVTLTSDQGEVGFGFIRGAPTGSKASPKVRYAFNSDRICASQRTDAMFASCCGEQMQQTMWRLRDYSITASASASQQLRSAP